MASHISRHCVDSHARSSGTRPLRLPSGTERGGTVLTHWDKLKAAERMQKYIEAHLGDRITMATLARVASYSQWHAARGFREVTGKSPFEYVRLRRLSVAAEELQNTSRKVVDVAFDFVFDSHEGFTRAFARQF